MEAEFLVIRSICSVVDPLSYFLKIIAFDSISSLAVEMFYLEVFLKDSAEIIFLMDYVLVVVVHTKADK